MRRLSEMLALSEATRIEVFTRFGCLFVMAHYKVHDARRAAKDARFLDDALGRLGAGRTGWRMRVLDQKGLEWFCRHDRRQFDRTAFSHTRLD
jgi:hypothetical protein